MDTPAGWQRLGAECLGTAFLIFIGVGSVPAATILNGTTPFTMASVGFVALSFATAVIACVYVFGSISGCHINPAVTLALAATGRFAWRSVPGYLIAQVVGAGVGALAIVGALGTHASDLGLGVASYEGIPVGQAFTAEFIGTFILVFTVFGVTHSNATPGFAGLVIGLVVFAAIVPIAPATGASINPARTTGPMVVQQLFGASVQWEQWPVYVSAELLGGIVAGAVFLLLVRVSANKPEELTLGIEDGGSVHDGEKV